MTAVVGASGAGKSTLAQVLLGLHRPDKRPGAPWWYTPRRWARGAGAGSALGQAASVGR